MLLACMTRKTVHGYVQGLTWLNPLEPMKEHQEIHRLIASPLFIRKQQAPTHPLHQGRRDAIVPVTNADRDVQEHAYTT